MILLFIPVLRNEVRALFLPSPVYISRGFDNFLRMSPTFCSVVLFFILGTSVVFILLGGAGSSRPITADATLEKKEKIDKIYVMKKYLARNNIHHYISDELILLILIIMYYSCSCVDQESQGLRVFISFRVQHYFGLNFTRLHLQFHITCPHTSAIAFLKKGNRVWAAGQKLVVTLPRILPAVDGRFNLYWISMRIVISVNNARYLGWGVSWWR